MISTAAQKNQKQSIGRVFLVGIATESIHKAEASELLDELHGLTQTLGLEMVGETLVQLREITPSLLVGTGKAQELLQAAEAAGADAIILTIY